jgi:hypothetical protein
MRTDRSEESNSRFENEAKISAILSKKNDSNYDSRLFYCSTNRVVRKTCLSEYELGDVTNDGCAEVRCTPEDTVLSKRKRKLPSMLFLLVQKL